MQWLKLKYGSWGSSLLEEMNRMRMNNEMCDVSIILENDNVLQAHSNVLAAASPFFKSILVGTENPEVNMQDFPVDIVKCVLEFIYTGSTVVKKMDLLILHSVSASLNIPLLSDMAQKMVQHSLPQVKSTSKDAEHSKITITPNLETTESYSADVAEAVEPVVIVPETDSQEDMPVSDHMEMGEQQGDDENMECQDGGDSAGAGIKKENVDEDEEGGDEGEHSYAAGDSTMKPKVIGSLVRKDPSHKIQGNREATLKKTPSKPITLYSSPNKQSISEAPAKMEQDSYVYEIYDGPDGMDAHSHMTTNNTDTGGYSTPSSTATVRNDLRSDSKQAMNTSDIFADYSDGEMNAEDDDDDEFPNAKPDGFKVMYKVIKADSSDAKDKLLSSDGYSYVFHRSGTFGKLWRCIMNKKKCACAATVKQLEEKFIRGEKRHNHGPKLNELTIKSEHGGAPRLDLDADREKSFSAYQVGSLATKTYRIAQNASRRGKDLLVDSDGFKYNLRKHCRKVTIWNCSVRSKSCTCPATISQKGSQFIPSKKTHIHDPESNKPFGWVRPPRKEREKSETKYIPPEPVSTPAAPNQDIDGVIYTVITNNGKEKLVASDGFTYVHKRVGVHSVQWRCNARSNNNICSASVRQYEDMFVVGKQTHIHEANQDLVTTPNIRRQPPGIPKLSFSEEQPSLSEPAGNDDENEENSQVVSETSTSQGEGKTYRVIARATQTGADMMIDSDGYKYTVKRREGRITGWKCSVRNRFCTCSATVLQSGGVFRVGRHPHKHAPNSNKPYGMENIVDEKPKKPKVQIRTRHIDDGFKGNPYEDEYGNKYMILEKASKTKTDKLICSDGFSYTARRVGVHGTQWKCTMRHKPHNCLGSVRQVGELFVRGIRSHTHPAEPNMLTGSFPGSVQTTPTMYLSNGKTYSILHRASKAGKNILEDSDGYRYNFKSAGPNSINWRCSVRNSTMTCSASVKQVGDSFTPGKFSHNHLPVHEATADLLTQIEGREPAAAAQTQLQSDSNNVVELVLVGDEGTANYEFSTTDGQTTFQLPPGMVIQQLVSTPGESNPDEILTTEQMITM